MNSRIALVTWSGLPSLAPDDALLAAELRRRGHDVTAPAWDEAVDWTRFDAIILRSCWDYHLRAAAFMQWLDALDQAAVHLWNPTSLVRWNTHKGYLVELSEVGLPVIPTALVPQGDDRALAGVLEARGWTSAVLKPAVGASAWGTRRITPATADAEEIEPWRAAHDLLIQPFLEEIAGVGEWSLIFVDGEFTHAVHKRPASGDFRVQHELGGSLEAADPPANALAVARRVLAAAPGPWLYARVDGVLTDAGFLLMELELIEPSLFLDLAPAALGRFADAITASVG